MIEVGQRYTLTELELTSEGYGTMETSVTVTAIEGNLVELDGQRVLNLNSPLFHSLDRSEDIQRLVAEINAIYAQRDTDAVLDGAPRSVV